LKITNIFGHIDFYLVWEQKVFWQRQETAVGLAVGQVLVVALQLVVDMKVLFWMLLKVQLFRYHFQCGKELSDLLIDRSNKRSPVRSHTEQLLRESHT
jgi:hypothetical protein